MLHASGVSLRNFGRRDLVGELQALRKSSGSWDNLVDHTSFGILAMRAGGVSKTALRGSALWMERQQNADGGFGFGPKGGSSDADDTGSAIQALVAVGRGKKSAARKALAYLRKAQNADGGFGQLKSDDSNAQSTAWAVQGIVAAGANPRSLRRNGHNPISYLVSLQQANGAVRYSRTSAQSPVWVTGQALTALARKPFPVAAPKRKAPVQVAKTKSAIASKPKTQPAKTQPPIAHTAKKKPKSHGQTISPTPTATTAGDPTMAAPTTAIAPAAQRTQPSTAHERKGHDHHDLAIGLAVFAVAALLAGTYLTRKRLRGRSSPA
jgi:hypothetical protein